MSLGISPESWLLERLIDSTYGKWKIDEEIFPEMFFPESSIAWTWVEFWWQEMPFHLQKLTEESQLERNWKGSLIIEDLKDKRSSSWAPWQVQKLKNNNMNMNIIELLAIKEHVSDIARIPSCGKSQKKRSIICINTIFHIYYYLIHCHKKQNKTKLNKNLH